MLANWDMRSSQLYPSRVEAPQFGSIGLFRDLASGRTYEFHGTLEHARADLFDRTPSHI